MVAPPIMERMSTTSTHTLRLATAADDAALRRLAALEETRALTGAVVLAEEDGRLVAALSLADGRSVADPFVRTAAARALLKAYAARLRPATASRRSPWSLLPQRRHLHASA
jgi:hypothetical protein